MSYMDVYSSIAWFSAQIHTPISTTPNMQSLHSSWPWMPWLWGLFTLGLFTLIVVFLLVLLQRCQVRQNQWAVDEHPSSCKHMWTSQQVLCRLRATGNWQMISRQEKSKHRGTRIHLVFSLFHNAHCCAEPRNKIASMTAYELCPSPSSLHLHLHRPHHLPFGPAKVTSCGAFQHQPWLHSSSLLQHGAGVGMNCLKHHQIRVLLALVILLKKLWTTMGSYGGHHLRSLSQTNQK